VFRFRKFQAVDCLTESCVPVTRVFAFIVKRFRVFRAPLHYLLGIGKQVFFLVKTLYSQGLRTYLGIDFLPKIVT
ncbi:hypothetical protein ACT7C1_07340, partial [Bacillus paranthracis]